MYFNFNWCEGILKSLAIDIWANWQLHAVDGRTELQTIDTAELSASLTDSYPNCNKLAYQTSVSYWIWTTYDSLVIAEFIWLHPLNILAAAVWHLEPLRTVDINLANFTIGDYTQ